MMTSTKRSALCLIAALSLAGSVGGDSFIKSAKAADKPKTTTTTTAKPDGGAKSSGDKAGSSGTKGSGCSGSPGASWKAGDKQ